MVIGAIVLLVGIGIGYFINTVIIKENKTVTEWKVLKPFKNREGIVVDLTPPIELDPIENEKENPIA